MTTKETLDRWQRMRHLDQLAIERRSKLSAAAAEDARLLAIIRSKFPHLSTAELIAAFELLETNTESFAIAQASAGPNRRTWQACLPPAEVEVTE